MTKKGSSRANKNPSVSFSDEVRCCRSIHINDYTDEEILNTWFTERDYKEMKREVQLTVAMMNKKSHFAEAINYSSRGLEDKTADKIVQKMDHRFFAIDAILDEQDRQRSAGIHDPNKFSLVYLEYSFVSHMAAFLVAATDEQIALGYHHDTSRTTITNKNNRKATTTSIVYFKPSPPSFKPHSLKPLYQISAPYQRPITVKKVFPNHKERN